jgi:hypothetical protein
VSIQLTLSQEVSDEDVDGSPGGYSNASEMRSVAQRMANASFEAGAPRDQDDLT